MVFGLVLMINPKKGSSHMQVMVNLLHSQIGIVANLIMLEAMSIVLIYGKDMDLDGMIFRVLQKILLFVNAILVNI